LIEHLDNLKPFSKKAHEMTTANLMEIIAKISYEAKVSIANYLNKEGTLIALPLTTKDFDSNFNFWYATNAQSEKAKEICDADIISINYTNQHHNQFVTMIGGFELVNTEDEKKKHHFLLGKELFPDNISDDKYALLKFSPCKIDLWDKLSGRFIQFLKNGESVVLSKDQEFKDEEFTTLFV